MKARLVAKGFQENCEDIRTDSPTCGKDSLRMILVIAATKSWKVSSLVIKSAFLQGRTIEREVYVKSPIDFGDGKLWKLNKCLYGLNYASREWYLKVDEAITEIGGKRSMIDNAVFFWTQNQELIGMCACHVDDFILCGSEGFLSVVISEIKNRFRVSSECDGMFKYIGLQIEQNGEDIKISQNLYAHDVTPFHLNSQDSYNETQIYPAQKRDLRSLVGQLLWISSHSRPDIAYDVCDISTSVKDATQRDLLNVNKKIRKMKMEDVKLIYPELGEISEVELICYTDASFKHLKGNASKGGHIVFLKGINWKYSPIARQSKKIKRIVKSTIAA